MKFAIRYTTDENADPDMGARICWVLDGEWGATSLSTLGMFYKTPHGAAPEGVLTFDTREAAADFFSGWGGHPLYHTKDPAIPPEIFEIEPKMVQVREGWTLKVPNADTEL